MSLIFYYKKKLLDKMGLHTDVLKEICDHKSDMIQLQEFIDSRNKTKWHYSEEVIMDLWININNKKEKDYIDARNMIKRAGLDTSKYQKMYHNYKIINKYVEIKK